jgi:cell division protein ZapA
MSSPVSVTVNILDKEYQISCNEEEKKSLLSSAAYVDEKMREIKSSGNTLGTDKIAILSALNIANELLNLSKVEEELNMVNKQIANIEASLDQAIDK